MIKPIIYLISKSKQDNSDPLNHTAKLSAVKYYGARVTELNGAQAQNNAFGEQYDKSWVIRCDGTINADYVGFENEFNEKTMAPKYQINQIRRHINRTTLYVVRTVAK